MAPCASLLRQLLLLDVEEDPLQRVVHLVYGREVAHHLLQCDREQKQAMLLVMEALCDVALEALEAVRKGLAEFALLGDLVGDLPCDHLELSLAENAHLPVKAQLLVGDLCHRLLDVPLFCGCGIDEHDRLVVDRTKHVL